MFCANRCSSKILKFAFALVAIAAFSIQSRAQEAAQTPQSGGVVDDWSTRHLVFPNPGTEQDALKSGHYKEWLKIVSEPRYMMQQQKRHSTVVQSTLVSPGRNIASRVNDGFRNRFGVGSLSRLEQEAVWTRYPQGLEHEPRFQYLKRHWSDGH